VSQNTGLNTISVHIPVGMAARVQVDSGIGNVSISPSHQRNGNIYTSNGFNGANNRLELRIHGGIRRVSVEN
jgi:hypothetical protein